MDSASLALCAVGALWVLFAFWVWNSIRFMENASNLHSILHELHEMDADEIKNLSSRLDAVQAIHAEDCRVLQKACAVGPVERRVDGLEQRIAGVEALMVSTVGQETEDFCRAMDALMERMENAEEKKEPTPKPRPAPKEKLTLSKEFCGRYGKGRRRG